MRTYLAVIGGSVCDTRVAALAEQVGEEAARRNLVLVCGGLGGVMEAACRGARRYGGITVGLLPSYDRGTGNPWLHIALPTGLGHARNVLVVAAADAVVALAGEHGTASEIHLARVLGKPVVACCAWAEMEAVVHTTSARDAVEQAMALAGQRP